MTGTGAITMGQGARIKNMAGAQFYVQGNTYLSNSGTGTEATFENAGTFSVELGAASFMYGVTFINDGIVNVRAGVLTISLGSGLGSFFLGQTGT